MSETASFERSPALRPVESADEIGAWAKRPVANIAPADVHALTVDVEDYFHVEAFSGVIDRGSWDRLESRIERNVDRVLEMFSGAQVHATFFTLGWVAERHPSLVRRIVDCGHELASHGLAHHRADSQNRLEFLHDVTRSKKILEDIGGVGVKGYRAASFSINRGNIWAYDMLDEAGYRYSSSLYPARYVPEAPQFAFHPVKSSRFIEIPITSVQRFGFHWPCGGGGFFRLFPYRLSAQNLRMAERRDKKRCVFYFHPWEIDPNQPRVNGASLTARIRHYTNVKKMHARLTRLLADFRWNRLDRIYPQLAS
jgi:polysaccharide deacetylase family protein (PEP-CTERM system associated)